MTITLYMLYSFIFLLIGVSNNPTLKEGRGKYDKMMNSLTPKGYRI